MTEAESLLKTSDDAEINWEANTCDIIEALEEKEKALSEEKREDATDDYSTGTNIKFPNSFKSSYLPKAVFNK